MRLGRRLSSGIAEDPPASEPAEPGHQPTREPAPAEVATADARPAEHREHAAHLAQR